MRTARSLPYGGVSVQGALFPPLWTESQTHVKTLPCRNFVAGGKYEWKNEYHLTLVSVRVLTNCTEMIHKILLKECKVLNPLSHQNTYQHWVTPFMNDINNI